MENINSILLVVQVLLSISLIVLILLQHGKGADAGAAFGSGASATVFGSQGSGSFLTRITAVLGAAFFIISLTLAYMNAKQSTKKRSVTEQSIPVEAGTPAPAKTAEPPAAADVPVIPGADTASPAGTKPDLPADKPASDVPKDVPN